MITSNLLNNPESTIPAPTPLSNPLPKVKALDPDMLPEPIKAYILDVASRHQSPPDFVAIAAICGLAAIVGRKVVMRPKQNDDWAVTPNLWGMIIGRPSAMKSPSMKEALRLLIKIEADSTDQFVDAKKRHSAEREFAALQKENSKSEAKKMAKKGNKTEALRLLEEAEFSEPEPTRPRLIVNDTSIEKLGELLNENPNGLLFVRDELFGLLTRLGKEEFQSDRAFYLECFDGNSRYTYDRIGRGTIVIENCTLSIIGGIQPARISSLVRETLSGTADDGLIQRFQLAVWPDDVGEWEWTDRTPNAAARKQYDETFFQLHELTFPPNGEEPYFLNFTPEAQELFIRWMESIQANARAEGLHPALESHLLKMPQTIASLALLFELIEGGRTHVGITATSMALAWADYLRSHSERLYSLASTEQLQNAHLLLKRKKKLNSPFTARDVHRKGWVGLNDLNAINEALEYLVDHHHLTPAGSEKNLQGGCPTIRYHWNE